MNETERLIAAFHADGADKLQLVRALESESGDGALAFLANVATSNEHDDFVRVEALKALRVWGGCAPDVARDVAAVVGRTLRSNDDDVVRGFAGMALSRFFHVPGVFDVLRAVVCDEHEDEDVRHDAFDALEDHVTDPRVQDLLRRLARGPGSIGAAARRKAPSP